MRAEIGTWRLVGLKRNSHLFLPFAATTEDPTVQQGQVVPATSYYNLNDTVFREHDKTWRSLAVRNRGTVTVKLCTVQKSKTDNTKIVLFLFFSFLLFPCWISGSLLAC